MKKETKKQIAETAAISGATAAGVASGAILAELAEPFTAQAGTIEAKPNTAPEAKPEPAHQPTHQPQPNPEPTPQPEPKPEPQPEPEPDPEPKPGPDPEPEVKVIGYERVEGLDGNQWDVATIADTDGNVLAVVDVDLNGTADIVICDLNQNGMIEENEIADISGQNLAMQPFAEAAGFNPLMAQNNMPDYQNDADVNVFEA